jgi:hypothetical protein
VNGPKIWYTILSADNYLIQMFKEKCKWPETKEDESKRRKLLRKKELKICKNCGKEFTEEENQKDSCSYHTSPLLYFESDRSMYEEIKGKELKEKLGKKNDIEFMKQETKKFREQLFSNINLYRKKQIHDMKDEINLADVRWRCCGREFFDKGENVCFHKAEIDDKK